MLDQSYYEKADEIIEFYGRKASSLIPIMQDIQAEYRYLPGELLTYVAKEIGVREAKAYSVATPSLEVSTIFFRSTNDILPLTNALK